VVTLLSSHSTCATLLSEGTNTRQWLYKSG